MSLSDGVVIYYMDENTYGILRSDALVHFSLITFGTPLCWRGKTKEEAYCCARAERYVTCQDCIELIHS